MSVFREYTKEPADPIGLDQVSIWQRLFKKWAKQFFIRTVSGGRLVPDPNGGVHLIIDKPLIPSVAKSSSGAGGNFRGIYDPFTAYSTNDLVIYDISTVVNFATGLPIGSLDTVYGYYFQNGTGGSPITGTAPFASTSWTFIGCGFIPDPTTGPSGGTSRAPEHRSNPGFLWCGNYNSALEYSAGAAVKSAGHVYYNPSGDHAGTAPPAGNWVQLS